MIAEGKLRHGAQVYITSRTQSSTDAATAQLALIGDCIPIEPDVASRTGTERLREQLAKRESKVDILVHNAGAVWHAPFAALPESGWDRILDLNLKSPFFLTQALHSLLQQAGRNRRAKVINIACNSIAPGEFPSAMNREARDNPDTAASRAPAARVGTSEDIAGAVVCLASRAGDYMVRSSLTVDGGLSLSRG